MRHHQRVTGQEQRLVDGRWRRGSQGPRRTKKAETKTKTEARRTRQHWLGQRRKRSKRRRQLRWQPKKWKVESKRGRRRSRRRGARC